MNELLEAAQYYKTLGFSVLAVRENKQSLGYWKSYQKRIISDFVLERDFNDPDAFGIAIICGKVSGNLEGIDLDGKYDPKLFERFKNDLLNYDADLYSNLVIASTRNSGHHFLYRCDEISNHSTLAKRPCTKQEKDLKPDQKVKTLMEKLGEHSYMLVYPSPGYQFIQGSIETIPKISPSTRNDILKITRSYDQLTERKITRPTFSSQEIPELSPFHDYDTRGDFINLLEYHGWKLIKIVGMRTYFRRPGDTEHDTSGDYHQKLGLFTVFTPNCEFTPYTGYRPHAIYAILECNSDFKLAAKRLLQQGYGVSYKQRY